MPSRIIRDTILDSERYLSIGEPERLFFLHLCLLADDLGCLSLAPAFLGRRAFSERPGPARIEKLLAALEGVDLLRRYEFQGSPYGFIPRFRQRVQRETLKHPAPPHDLIADQKDAVEMFARIKAKGGKVTVGERRPNGSAAVGNGSGTAEVEVKGSEEKRSEGGNGLHKSVTTPGVERQNLLKNPPGPEATPESIAKQKRIAALLVDGKVEEAKALKAEGSA